MRTTTVFIVALAITTVITTACARHRGSEAAVAPRGTTTAEAPVPPASTDLGESAVTVAPEIRDACGLAETQAFFAYDSAAIRPTEDVALRKIADCFRDGPLAGRTVILVGHADPRGSDEYNMVLGSRRAEAVGSALVARRLSREQVQTTSRGEFDASGVDESGWTKDRKVNVELAR